MERLYPQLILDALKNVRYPASGKDIVSAGMVEDDIRIDGNKVSFSLVFDRPTDPFIKSLVRASEAATVDSPPKWKSRGTYQSRQGPRHRNPPSSLSPV